MPKKIIYILFSVVFLLFIVSPITLVITQNSLDVSEIFSNSEEEKGNEKHLDFEILLPLLKSNSSQYFGYSKKNILAYVFKRYSKPRLNIIFHPQIFSCKIFMENA